MDDAPMSAELNNGFIDMAKLSNYFTGNKLNMFCWQENIFLSKVVYKVQYFMLGSCLRIPHCCK